MRIKLRKNFWALRQFCKKIFKPKKGNGSYKRIKKVKAEIKHDE